MVPSVPLIVLQKLSDQTVKFGLPFHSSILPRDLTLEIPLLIRYRPSFELFFCKKYRYTLGLVLAHFAS